MRILASCPRAYRTLACGADVPETCHPAAGHTAGETDPVLAGIRSRSLRVASMTTSPGQAFSVKRSGTKESRTLPARPSLGMYLIPGFRPPYICVTADKTPGSCKT
jgi:hypothetical protein